MAAHQALPSLGFSRQEHWSGLPFPSPMHESEKWKWNRSVVSNSSRPHGLQPTRLLCPWDFPGKSIGVGCHCLIHHCFLRSINKASACPTQCLYPLRVSVVRRWFVWWPDDIGWPHLLVISRLWLGQEEQWAACCSSFRRVTCTYSHGEWFKSSKKASPSAQALFKLVTFINVSCAKASHVAGQPDLRMEKIASVPQRERLPTDTARCACQEKTGRFHNLPERPW